MASFFDDLRPASFRGISFLVPDDEKAFARRIQVHQYPGRDAPFHEDLGADVDEYNITAVIHGPNYISKAKSLEEALKSPGIASLVHPHYGTIQVVVMRVRRAHSTAEGGVVRFSITCQKAGVAAFPTSAANTISALSGAGDDLFSKSLADFNDNFSILRRPDWLQVEALASLSSAADLLSSSMSKGGLKEFAGSILPGEWDLFGDLGTQFVSIFQSLSDLGKTPNKTIVGGDTLTSSASSTSVIRVLNGVSASTGTDASAQDASGRNKASIDLMTRSSALAASSKAARYATYESREQAISIRDKILANADALMNDLGKAGWNSTWSSAASVSGAVSRDINQRIGRLPRTAVIRPASVRSSLDLSNRLYGDDKAQIIARAQDISIRNRARHPGMMPVKNLEVLIDA
ncbi:MAG: hypothetical protein DI551_09235 [Micavibrio aeruginosavorus]|uniref:DNA circulation N-terminal domain-containing protein n=1 Tax=Micavibrio aeruginosavorus TaxID=349221 RepID=A0A2W5MVP6_9BACT|nr:MAG: hypothetical protein DI551_09235 [Micavibrio aeruginosavorus]